MAATTCAVPNSIPRFLDGDGNRHRGDILVAVSGGEDLAPACTAARLLGNHFGVPVRIVSAVEPAEDYASLSTVGEMAAGLEQSRRSMRDADIRRRLRDIGVSFEPSEVDVLAGSAPHALETVARERRAQLIVMGRRKHRLVGRILGGETAFRTLRAARLPVLTTGSAWNALPGTIVVAMDFSAASVAAAQGALDMAAEGATVHLVHVWTRNDSAHPAYSRSNAIYEASLPERFGRVERSLRISRGATLRNVVLTGKPVEELVSFAEELDADLIASGTRGAVFFDRFIIGSVANGLLRSTTCAVLIVPAAPSAESERLEQIGAGRSLSSRPEEWPELLKEFSARHQARRSVLEVDDPAVGAQIQQRGYFFRGATYDPREGSVQLMFGARDHSAVHFTRSIHYPRQIAVRPADLGSEEVLRVAHGNGHTLLSFLP